MSTMVENNEKVLSSSLLFRHGARGPGDSELTPFAPEHPIVQQWQENDLENLTSVGLLQMQILGRWYANLVKATMHFGSTNTNPDQTTQNSTNSNNSNTTNNITPKLRFCSSISSRALESGLELVYGFQKMFEKSSDNSTTMPMLEIVRNEYGDAADTYFRPWKAFPEIDKLAKSNRDGLVGEWKETLEAHQEFLSDIAEKLNMKDSMKTKLQNVLWSMTHVLGLLQCELSWPRSRKDEEDDLRVALTKTLPEEMHAKVVELSCFVWTQRFLATGFQYDLGGWMFLEMIQKTFDYEECPVNVFAGHDYTVISLLAATHIITQVDVATMWGSYILFQLVTRPTSTTTTTTTAIDNNNNNNNNNNELILRITFNPAPFNLDGKDSTARLDVDAATVSVNTTAACVTKELTMAQLKTLIHTITSNLLNKGRTLPPHFVLPIAIANATAE